MKTHQKKKGEKRELLEDNAAAVLDLTNESVFFFNYRSFKGILMKRYVIMLLNGQRI